MTSVFGLSALGDILKNKEASTVHWLVDGMIQANAPVLIHAPSKCCKTTLSVDLAIACATGGTWLGRQAMQTNVAFVSVEDGLAGLCQTVRFICDARGVPIPATQLHIGSQVEDISNLAVHDAMTDFFVKNEIGLAVFDPAYLILGEYQQQAMNDGGGKLYRLSEVCRNAGATCVVLHHNKSTGRGLTAAAGAGFSQWPSSWVSITRRGAYKLNGIHSLNLEYGGRIGQTGEMHITINEGLSSEGMATQCEICFQPMTKQRTLFDVDQRVAPARTRLTLDSVVRSLSTEPQSATAIQSKTGGSKQKVRQYLDLLVSDGTAKKDGEKYAVAG